MQLRVYLTLYRYPIPSIVCPLSRWCTSPLCLPKRPSSLYLHVLERSAITFQFSCWIWLPFYLLSLQADGLRCSLERWRWRWTLLSDWLWWKLDVGLGCRILWSACRHRWRQADCRCSLETNHIFHFGDVSPIFWEECAGSQSSYSSMLSKPIPIWLSVILS